MAQVVLAFIVVAAAVFYILIKAPQTDAQAPASTAPAVTAAPVPPPPAPVPESVNGFKPGKEFQAVSAATASHSRGKGYQRAGGSSKAAWIGVAIVLAVGLVGGVAVGVPYFKKLKEQANNNPNNNSINGNNNIIIINHSTSCRHASSSRNKVQRQSNR